MRIPFLLLPAVALWLIGVGANAQDLEWIRVYGPNTSDGYDIAWDGTSKLYMGGSMRVITPTFEGLPMASWGYTDGLICRTDGQGTVEWAETIGAFSSEQVESVLLHDGLLHVAGSVVNYSGNSAIHYKSAEYIIPYSCCNNGYVMQLDTAGDVQWLFHTDGHPRDMLIDPAGNIFVVTFSSDSSYVYKISSSGSPLMQAAISSFPAGNERMAMDAAGNIYLTSNFLQPCWFMGDTFATNGLTDGLLGALSPGGNVLWNRQIGGPGYDPLADLVVDADGDLRVMGSWTDTVDVAGTTFPGTGERFVLARFDAAGNFLDANDTTFLTGPISGDLEVNGEGALVSAINFQPTLITPDSTLETHTFGGYDGAGVLARWTDDGALVWYRVLGSGTNENTGHASFHLGAFAGDSIFLCGQMNNAVQIDDSLYNASLGYASFVALMRDTTYAISTGGWTEEDPRRTRAYPNPATRSVRVTANRPWALAELHDGGGRRLRSWPGRGMPDAELDLSGIAPGRYVLLLLGADGREALPLVVVPAR